MADIQGILSEAYQNRSPQPSEESLVARESGVKRIRGLRILVIDGGGSRGIVPITILQHLEERLKNELKAEVIHLGDFFDLIAGTSAGGLIALAHGHKRLQLKDIAYFFASGAAFKNKKGLANVARPVAGFFADGSHKVKEYENDLRIAFGENGEDAERLDGDVTGMSQRAKERDCLMYSPNDKRPRVFVVANPCNTPDEILFTNYRAEEYVRDAVKDHDRIPLICSSVHAWEAARATSAAPTYFGRAAIKIPELNSETHHFWDGGIVNNSPVCEAIHQAEMLFGYDRGIELVVSLGCGNFSGDNTTSNASGLDNRSKKETTKDIGSVTALLNDLTHAITNSAKEFEQARRELISNPRTRDMAFDSLYRINPEMNCELDIAENVPHKIEAAEEAVNTWCGIDENNHIFDSIVQILARKYERNEEKDLSDQEKPRAKRMYLSDQEKVRAEAFTAAKGFAPPLAPLSNGSPLRSSAPLEVTVHGPTKWNSKFDESVTPILTFFKSVLGENDDEIYANAVLQVKTKDDGGIARDVATLRRVLWRGYVNPLIEEMKVVAAKQLKEGKYLDNDGQKNWNKVLRYLLPLDKANALYSMKVDRKNPSCPRGFAWISREDFKNLPKKDDLKFGDKKHRHSIDDNYVRLKSWLEDQGDTKNELYRLLEDYLKPAYPDWVNERFGKKV